MTSTVHHPVAVPSRGLIICEMEDESNEPKTILEIGGVARPRPTYIIPPPPPPPPPPSTSSRPPLPTAINSQPYLGHWKAQHDVVPSPYPAYTEFHEQKIIRLSNANWSGPLDKLSTVSPLLNSKGNTFSFGNSKSVYKIRFCCTSNFRKSTGFFPIEWQNTYSTTDLFRK